MPLSYPPLRLRSGQALRKVREGRDTRSCGGFCTLKAGPPAQSGSYKEVIPASGWRTIRCELTAASPPDQVHACQMMTEVHTVSIVAKNKYSGRAGVLPHPKRGGT